ncbi:MAG: hypothetical protein IH820_09695 [Bacteroidetes bacterium]|nr:hypothetical protein [Bacteroidota bacterium]
MNRTQHPIDEYTLAAFLSGTLSEEQRREVVAYLAENADARELLCMAHEALEAAQQPAVVQPFTTPTTAPEQPAPSHEPIRRMPRPATRPAIRPARVARLQRLRRFATAAVMVTVLVIGLRVGLSLNDIDTQRGATDENAALEVQVSTPALQFQWTELPDAYYYRLVIYDVEAAELVAQHETKSTRLGRNDAFLLSLRDKLKLHRTYQVRIDAVDVQNRLIQDSDLVSFILDE